MNVITCVCAELDTRHVFDHQKCRCCRLYSLTINWIVLATYCVNNLIYCVIKIWFHSKYDFERWLNRVKFNLEKLLMLNWRRKRRGMNLDGYGWECVMDRCSKNETELRGNWRLRLEMWIGWVCFYWREDSRFFFSLFLRFALYSENFTLGLDYFSWMHMHVCDRS